MDKKEISYEDCTLGIGGQSMPSRTDWVPLENDYEAKRNSDFNQSGFERKK